MSEKKYIWPSQYVLVNLVQMMFDLKLVSGFAQYEMQRIWSAEKRWKTP